MGGCISSDDGETVKHKYEGATPPKISEPKSPTKHNAYRRSQSRASEVVIVSQSYHHSAHPSHASKISKDAREQNKEFDRMMGSLKTPQSPPIGHLVCLL